MSTPEEILTFWFGADSDSPLENAEAWWKSDEEFDRTIRERFAEDHAEIAGRRREGWLEEPRSALAYIIVLDQFSRNMFRGEAEMFAQDDQAVEAALAARREAFDEEVSPVERVFFYMPLMHAEDEELQELSVALFDELRRAAPEELREPLDNNYEFAVKHADVVREFGRFPHRNEVLGRDSTPDERAFLEEHGRGF